ncbi:MAG: hemoglobin [Lentimonas sp.]|jgi:hemoglobin
MMKFGRMKSLYVELGENTIKELVSNFYELVYSNEIIAKLFVTDIEEVKHKQFCFLTQFFGGPTLYSSSYGPPRMRRRHLPHAIDKESKDEWLKCMRIAINQLEISADLKVKVYSSFPILAQHMVNK